MKIIRKSPILSCVICAVCAVILTFLIVVSAFGGFDYFSGALKFSAINKVIDEYYIGETTSGDIRDKIFSDMITSLNDRWSYYMTAADYRSYLEYSSNRMTGIGITISAEDGAGYPVIIRVADNSPASLAAIASGDRITAIAGQSIKGETIAKARELIIAQGDNEFSMSLTRPDGKEYEVSLKAAVIIVNPISFENKNGIGYVKILNFEAGSADGAIRAIDSLIDQGCEGIVFDVRGNPGGKVSELTRLLDYLLPEGDIFVSVDRDGKEDVIRSKPGFIDKPMCVLIDKNSYSAAEFFAAALSEYGSAFTAGEETTGKSRSQITIRLFDGSSVHISSKSYLTPNRVDLAAQGGLTPDYPVAADNLDDGDNQLTAAIDELRNSINN